jgi:tRNA1(Val) A37 N6-methylase TrmN6
LVARDNKVEIEGVEKQWAFCQYTQKNAEVNDIPYKMHQSDFLEFKDEVGFDYIISNPPFYHEGSAKSENEMRHTARYNTHLPMDEFFKKVSKLLRNRGHFIFCYDPQQFQQIALELAKVKLTTETVQFIHPKLDRKASLVMVQARKGSKSLMKTREPFITFDKEEFSLNVQEIYKKARTHSIKCTL